MTSPWHGLRLPPVERAGATETIARVAAELAKQSPSDPSLAGGASGVALLFANLAEAEDSDAHAERAVGLAEDALATTVAEPNNAGLYQGLTGPAWLLAHLDGWLLELAADEDPNDAVDDAVLDLLSVPTWQQDFDLISGLVGLGVYALERRRRPTAARVLERIVTHLSALAERDADGVTWHTAPDLLPEHQRAVAPHGYHNLGVAHGVPGVIGLLASICDTDTDIASPAAAELLEGAVEWVLSRQLSCGGFASWLDGMTEPHSARSAWCYGDPGVAAMLLRASATTGRHDWADVAVDVAVHAAARSLENSGVVDAGICHGAAGLALIYHRMWNQTGDERLHDAARRWLAHSLDLLPLMTEVGMLEGRAGVALVLLAATGTEPAWDRTLLLSAPHGEQ